MASFRSTLAEARDADLHLHVVDAADPALRDQYGVTRKVLAEIGAAEHPRLLILNKSDLLQPGDREALAREFPDALLMAATSADDVHRLHGEIQALFERSMQEEEFIIPYDQQDRVSLLHERCHVLEERYQEDGAHVRVLAPAALLGGLRRDR